MTFWANEVSYLQQLSHEGLSLEEIGNKYDVSKQRMYQVFTKFGISTPCIKRKNFLKDKGSKVYWLDRILRMKKVLKTDRLIILEKLNIPDYCPILNIKLNYDGVESHGWTREECSPSLDQIIPNKGYTLDNIQIISWRANRIKNNATPEELKLIADYMINLTKNNLQL